MRWTVSIRLDSKILQCICICKCRCFILTRISTRHETKEGKDGDLRKENSVDVKMLSKVKCTHVQALRLCTGCTAHRESSGIALTFIDHGNRRGWEVSLTPRPLFTPGKTRYPLYRRLDWPQGRSGQVLKISSPPGFEPRTVQPLASLYADYATRP